MAQKLTLEVAVPERDLVRQKVDEVQVKGREGYLGILPGHAPLMTELGFGVLSYRDDSVTNYLAIHGGVMEVLPDSVRILADRATPAEEIDVERAREALRRAIDLIQNHEMETDIEEAQDAIVRAQARIEAYDRAK